MRRSSYLVLFSLLLACESSVPTADATRAAQERTANGAGALAETSFALRGDQRIAELSRGQARQLCRKAGQSIDLCHVAARNNGSQQCAAQAETCQAQDPGPGTDCSDARFDFPEPCSATVAEYLDCVDAWGKQRQDCTFERMSTPTPYACLPLLQHCPYLEAEFGTAASIVPPCDATSPPRVDENADIIGLDPRRPAPARMVTLGDSIAWCYSSALAGSSCAPTLISDYVREQYAPGLPYRSFALPGARTAALLTQAAQVQPGPGHLWIWIYMGGNDLSGCGLPALPDAQACADNLLVDLPTLWSQFFALFDDLQRFPDGVTFLLNTQYSLRDQCVHWGGPERGVFADTTIRRFNEQVIMQAALDRPNVIAIDQYPDFLGHASNADRQGCPHCSRDDNSMWLYDGTHPNDAGNRHIADKWKLAIDQMLAP